MSYKIVLLFIMTLVFLALWVLIHFRGQNRLLSRVFNFFVLNMAGWSFGLAMFYVSNNLIDSLFWAKVLYTAGGLIPPSFLLYSYVFSQEQKILSPPQLFLLFLPNILLFVLFFFTPFMIKEIVLEDNVKVFVYGPFHLLWDIIFNVVFLRAFFRFVSLYKKSNSLVKEHLKYIILGTFSGYILAGFTNVILPIFSDCSLLWLGPPLTTTWLAFIAYTIIKHRILDIKIVIARSAIFICVYCVVLGLPIWVGYKLLGYGLWLIPIILMGFFSTVGPFLYFFIQKKTEDALLQEQRRYQSTLRQASAGMGKIKELKKLLNLIVYIVTRAVRLNHALVYIYDESKKGYILGASKRRNGKKEFIKIIPNDSILIKDLIKTGLPIIYEELKQRKRDVIDDDLSVIENIVSSIQGELVFPILIEKKLIAIIVLGKKESGKLYGEDDISVFSILANQAALAIENAQFYEDMKRTHEQLFQAEKMATIGTMADGLSHQINNRFHALGFIAGDALDTIKMNKDKEMPPNIKEIIIDLERAFTRVQENVVQGGEVVQGLLRYTRKGDAGFSAVNFDKAFTSAFEMAQFKIKTHELKVMRLYDSAEIPKIKGNFTQLQEVFFNLVDNGYDAMMQRKNELMEPDYQPALKIMITKEEDKVRIVFEDNGMGVKEDDIHKLFTPFFTTKLSSKKGTGLGLYVIKKIIEDNHKGTVQMISEYTKGTQMVLTLPIAFE